MCCISRHAGEHVCRLHPTAHSGTVRARLYVVAVFVAGCFVLAQSVLTLRTTQPPVQWWPFVALT